MAEDGELEAELAVPEAGQPEVGEPEAEQPVPEAEQLVPEAEQPVPEAEQPVPEVGELVELRGAEEAVLQLQQGQGGAERRASAGTCTCTQPAGIRRPCTGRMAFPG